MSIENNRYFQTGTPEGSRKAGGAIGGGKDNIRLFGEEDFADGAGHGNQLQPSSSAPGEASNPAIFLDGPIGLFSGGRQDGNPLAAGGQSDGKAMGDCSNAADFWGELLGGHEDFHRSSSFFRATSI